MGRITAVDSRKSRVESQSKVESRKSSRKSSGRRPQAAEPQAAGRSALSHRPAEPPGETARAEAGTCSTMNGMPHDERERRVACQPARPPRPPSPGRDARPRRRRTGPAGVPRRCDGRVSMGVGALRLSISTPSRAIVLAVVLLLVRRWRYASAPAHPLVGRVVAWVRARFDRAALVPPLPRRAGSLQEWVGAGALFLALTAVMLHQQVIALHSVPDFGDPLFSIWRLSWVAHQLPIDPRHLFDGNMFYPEAPDARVLRRDVGHGPARRAVPLARVLPGGRLQRRPRPVVRGVGRRDVRPGPRLLPATGGRRSSPAWRSGSTRSGSSTTATSNCRSRAGCRWRS